MRGDNKNEERSIEVTFDKAILTLKRKSPTLITTLVIKTGVSTRFSMERDEIVLTITDEDRDCMVSRLEQCGAVGAFVPAELIRVQVPKNKNQDYLYADLVQDAVGR